MISKLPVNEWLVLILVCFAVIWIKSFDQRQPGQERVYFTKYLQAIFYHWRKSEWELTAGSWRQALWTDAVYCLTLWATSCLVLLVSSGPQTQGWSWWPPWAGLSHVSHHSNNSSLLYPQLCLSWGFSSPKTSWQLLLPTGVLFLWACSGSVSYGGWVRSLHDGIEAEAQEGHGPRA